MAIAVVSHDHGAAATASRHVAGQLSGIGVDTSVRLWSDGRQWADLDTGATGALAGEAVDRIASSTVYARRTLPASSRDALAASLVGDRSSVAAALAATPALIDLFDAPDPRGVERACAWVLDRVERFHDDGNRLDVPDATRLLVAVRDIDIRDVLWEDMTRANATSHVALWTDLTRRAPDEVRAAPAALLGFASWLDGDGARAWCALDQVPAGQRYPLAAIVAATLETGVHPREWQDFRGHSSLRAFATAFEESYDARTSSGPHPPERPGAPITPHQRPGPSC